MNHAVLTGNLGADPDIFYAKDGNPVATFNLAFKSGKEKTGWIKITCFGKLAEIAQDHLHKGDRIGVVGTLDQERWETREGQARTGYKLIAREIEFIKTGSAINTNRNPEERGTNSEADSGINEKPDEDRVPF